MSHAMHAGVADMPISRVYHMGAGDVYVHAFRRWLQLAANGGPFGPQNAHWLQVNICVTHMYEHQPLSSRMCTGIGPSLQTT